jgi:hypothetical protein
MRQTVLVSHNKTCVTFQSKVVSRLHAEIWCDSSGQVLIRDTKSSSGTFLNRMRLSPSSTTSRPFPLRDGDTLQFGIDYQGGQENLYRAIKVRVEIDRIQRQTPSEFGSNMLQQLRDAQEPQLAPAAHIHESANASSAQSPPTRAVTECCICLLKIRVGQPLFVTPCSHFFHYKCIQPLIQLHYPGFSCPLCRTFADLEADPEDDTDEEADAKHPAPMVTVTSEEVPDTTALAPPDTSDSRDAVYADAITSPPLLASTLVPTAVSSMNTAVPMSLTETTSPR